MRTSEISHFSWSIRTKSIQALEKDAPNAAMLLRVPFAGNGEEPVDGSWSGFADDLPHQGRAARESPERRVARRNTQLNTATNRT